MLITMCVLFAVIFGNVHGQDKTYNFREEEPEGTFVGNIALDLNLAALIAPSVFNNLHYSIMNWGDGAQFRVDENNSGLFTKYKLDREQLCRFEIRCVLKLRVAARSETDVKKYSIFVNLLDINDNAPKFNDSVTILQIPESVTIGKEYTLPGALDEDKGFENAIQSYTFAPSSETFSVVYFKHLDGTLDVNLIVNKPLDREIIDFYNLVLVAKDGGSPVKSASLVVKIEVTDDNDNTPRFSESQYRVQIGENTPSGAVIITPNAQDDDIGINSKLEYRLSTRQEARTSEMFEIDGKTGQLKSKTSLTSGSYTIIIEAVDGGSPQRVNQTEVIITVIDTENNPPVITIDPLNQDSKYAHVSETANKNAVVAHVSVFDPDSGPNGIVLCYSQSAFFDLHALDDNNYILVVVRTLDREQTSEYRVALFCEDSGTPRLNTTQIFDVIVDDINDNAPIFDKTNDQITLYEGNAINDVAMVLTATDKDAGVNAKLHFSLLNDSNGFFKIPPGSNFLVCAKKLDRETQDTHFVEIVVHDGGTPTLSATSTVTVSVLDINDVVPQFFRSSYKFFVPEGLPAESYVGTVSAIDLDLGDGGKLEFSFSKWSQDSGKFQILDNGTLKTLTPLDREASSMFTFTIQATDRGRPRLSSQVDVLVHVTDRNDNAPVFIFPSPSNTSVTLKLPVDTTKTLIKLQVVDADEGENGEVFFTLQPGNTSRLFYVDAINGELYTTRALTSDDIGVYNLTITATDRGETPLNTTKHLLVLVKQNTALYSPQSVEDKTTIVIGLGCGTLALIVIIVVIVCFVRRCDKGKPLRYLDNKTKNSASSVISAEKRPNQYSSHKESNNNLRTINKDDYITENTDNSDSTTGSGLPRRFEQYDLQIYPKTLKTAAITIKRDETSSSDKELNRMTSLRLQQAFQHISSIKSRLITPLDTSKPYEWREIRVPGHPGDFSSLSSRGTNNNNIDSGVGTDDDTVFLPRRISTSRRKLNTNHIYTSNTHHQHHPRYSSRDYSDVSIASSSSHPSLSSLSLPNLYLKTLTPFGLLNVRRSDLCSSDTIDDQNTTTSGSYSIDAVDHRGGRGPIQTRHLEHIHDIYV